MKFGKQIISIIFLHYRFVYPAFRLLSKLLLENSYKQLKSSQRISQDYHLHQPHALEKALQPFQTVQAPNIGSKPLVRPCQDFSSFRFEQISIFIENHHSSSLLFNKERV